MLQKMLSLFFWELQAITVLFLICDSYMSSRYSRFISLNLCVQFSIFEFVLFLLKFMFLLKKMHELFDFKMS